MKPTLRIAIVQLEPTAKKYESFPMDFVFVNAAVLLDSFQALLNLFIDPFMLST